MRHNRKIIYLTGLLFSMPLALTAYINSSFLSGYVSEFMVGVIYITASVIAIFSMAEMPRLLSRLGDRYTTILLSTLALVTLALLALDKSRTVLILAFIAFFVISLLIGATLDIFLEDLSRTSKVGRFRGIYLTFVNLSWVGSQMISGLIINKASFTGIYLLSAVFMFCVIVIFIFSFSNFKDPHYQKTAILKTLKFFLRNGHASKIYFINFSLQFFYAWMVIYTPIYLHQYIGFGWDKIGIIFMIMLLPFIILSFPLGEISDKIGEKKMLVTGFLVSALFTSLIPLVTAPAFFVWAGLLFATRVGAATIGVMSDSYFFKIVTKENAEATSFYRNTYPLAYIVAPLCAIPILAFVPSFKYIFLILSAVLCIGLFFSMRLKDVR